MNMDHRLSWLVLSELQGIGVTSFWQLVQYFGSPLKVIQSSPAELKKVDTVATRLLKGLASVDEIHDRCV